MKKIIVLEENVNNLMETSFKSATNAMLKLTPGTPEWNLCTKVVYMYVEYREDIEESEESEKC